MVVLTLKYRLYPTTVQVAKLSDWLEALRLLYTFALAKRQDAYKAQM
jgi:transposase